MKKEEIISSGVMTIVSILVLIGFTVAWYSADFGMATVFGMHLVAGQQENFIVALESQGADVAELAKEGKYASIGLEELTNILSGELAPGAFGEVTFYVRPIEDGMKSCEIKPQVLISQEEDVWYSGVGSSDAELIELYELVQQHIDFYSDPSMAPEYKIDDNLLKLIWTEQESAQLAEKLVVIYWKWHYEYPFEEHYTAEEQQNLSAVEVSELINTYDAEDTKIGNNVESMKFHFTFSAN